MIQKRFVSLLLCAALALCLLAGCDTAASGSTGSASAPANSSGKRDQLDSICPEADILNCTTVDAHNCLFFRIG